MWLGPATGTLGPPFRHEKRARFASIKSHAEGRTAPAAAPPITHKMQ